MQTLHNRRVLVTGATGGLGPSIVEALIAVGAEVFAAGRRRTALDTLRADLGDHERLQVAELDVSSFEGVDRLLHDIAARGGLHGVVHCAGSFAHGDLVDLEVEAISAMVQVNVTGTIAVVRSALTHIVEEGSIVLLGADRALHPSPKFSVYGAVKAASAHLGQAAALEAHPRRVRVNSILPGIVDTPTNRAVMAGADPSGWASPQAIAKAVVWLLGDESLGTSGALLQIPGM